MKGNGKLLTSVSRVYVYNPFLVMVFKRFNSRWQFWTSLIYNKKYIFKITVGDIEILKEKLKLTCQEFSAKISECLLMKSW